jgi:hypothetical protein
LERNKFKVEITELSAKFVGDLDKVRENNTEENREFVEKIERQK